MLDLMELNTKTLFSVGDQAYMDGSVLQTGEFRLKSLNPYNEFLLRIDELNTFLLIDFPGKYVLTDLLIQLTWS